MRWRGGTHKGVPPIAPSLTTLPGHSDLAWSMTAPNPEPTLGK